MVALAGLALSCRQPNPEWLGPDGATGGSGMSDGTAPSSTDGRATAADASASADGETGLEQCAPAVVLGEGECPEACDSCDGGRCTITCEEDICEDESISCPDEWPCDVVCDGKDACKNAEIACGSDRDCTVDCQGESSCEDAVVTCGSGTCTVSCGPQGDACDRLEVECGPADTTVTCQGSHVVDVEPSDGSPCACEAIDCDD